MGITKTIVYCIKHKVEPGFLIHALGMENERTTAVMITYKLQFYIPIILKQISLSYTYITK